MGNRHNVCIIGSCKLNELTNNQDGKTVLRSAVGMEPSDFFSEDALSKYGDQI